MKKTHLLVALACAMLTTACSEKQEKKQDKLNVTTEAVSKQATAASGNYVGEVEEEHATSLSFTSSGTIQQMLVDEGQYVRKGQLIAVMDETQMRNALATAEAMLAQAQDGYNRLKQVYEAGSLAEQKWVEMQTDLQQAQATRDMAKKSLQDCRLVSPVSGVVSSVSLRAGETALPSMPVCKVLDIENVKVKVAIPEQEISAISATTPSRIQVAAAGQETFQGGKIEKGVSADALTRTYDIKILVPNPGRKLLPGMVANVSLETEREVKASEHLYVPITSVHSTSSGQRYVWTVKDGVAKRANVTTGEAQGNRIAILSGLGEGEKIVVKGSQKLSEGSQVRE